MRPQRKRRVRCRVKRLTRCSPLASPAFSSRRGSEVMALASTPGSTWCEIGKADASHAWCASLMIHHPHYISQFAEDAQQAVWADGLDVPIAASILPSARVKPVDGGYRIPPRPISVRQRDQSQPLGDRRRDGRERRTPRVDLLSYRARRLQGGRYLVYRRDAGDRQQHRDLRRRLRR